MRILVLLLLTVCSSSLFAQQATLNSNGNSGKYVLVIHGGAGTLNKSQFTPALEAKYKSGLDSALLVGNSILEKGGTALDAVEATVKVLENNPLFNAGKGAVFTSEGVNELDAAIMDGKSLAAGSIAGVRTIKNPITAARAVMEKSEHIFEAFLKHLNCTY